MVGKGGSSQYELPSKCALIKYVPECASDVGCCMKPAKTIGLKMIHVLLSHTCAFCGVGILFAFKAGLFFHGWIHFTMNGCAHAVG